MTAMTKIILVAMALVLAVATAATAAMAGENDDGKRYTPEKSVADSVQMTSQAIIRAKLRHPVPNYIPPINIQVPQQPK